MPRYVTGTLETGDGGELYDVADYATDAEAVAAFEAYMKVERPDLRLSKEVTDDHEVVDFVARVAADFPMDAVSIAGDEIFELVETYDVRAID